jgi:hypothetical protein
MPERHLGACMGGNSQDPAAALFLKVQRSRHRRVLALLPRQARRSWAERAYPKLIHYNKLDQGGHFAAWEQPKLFAEEVRAGLRSLRNAI